MKTYDWKCKECKTVFENPEKVKCPACGSLDVYRLYRASIHFHGNGFYITDSTPPKDDGE